MIDEFLSELDSKQKLELVKYAAIFTGGVLVGYSIKKVIESYDLDVIKDNTKNMVEDYVNPKIKHVDNFVVDVVDEEDNDE